MAIRFFMGKAVLGVVALSAALVSVGCVGDAADPSEDEHVGDTFMSFEEFEAMTYQEPESGIYIVDGDTPVATREQLYEFYSMFVREGALIVHQSGGVDAVWDSQQKLNITYCVSTTFGQYYSATVNAMNSATGAWESAAKVNFVHLSQYDNDCTAMQANVVFDVRPVNSGQYLARAFFPNDARKNRNILVDGSAQTSNSPNLTGVLRHELGHTLGFRHEHTRPESGVCFEDNQWRALTSYDSGSVMHYPQCNGTGNWTLNLTTLDKQGAASLYGAAGGGGKK